MTLEEIFAAARELELHVHNLFEREDGRWQANVRERSRRPEGEERGKVIGLREYHHHFGVADNSVDALIEAINIAVAKRRKKT